MHTELLFEDNRGAIHRIAEHADVLRITSHPGARRANHYHKEYGHWCFVISGSIHYYERPVGSSSHPDVRMVCAGQMFWTGPAVEHLMLFSEATEFFCFSVGARDAASYATDTVNLTFKLDEQ